MEDHHPVTRDENIKMIHDLVLEDRRVPMRQIVKERNRGLIINSLLKMYRLNIEIFLRRFLTMNKSPLGSPMEFLS